MSFTSRARRTLAQPLSLILMHLPAGFYRRNIQMVLDGAMAALSLFIGYQLRFDGAVPPSARAAMYTWMPIVGVLCPLLMARVNVYQISWRYFGFRDAIFLGSAALLTTIVLLVFRFMFADVPLLVTPISVTLIAAVSFFLLASGIRGLRRLLSEEELFATGDRRRVLLVGNDRPLAAAVRQISEYRNLHLVGCVVPRCAQRLRGIRIIGCPVLGDTTELDKLLEGVKPGLIMITDASLDCIGEVVAGATHRGIEVRLLPSATNIVRGDVSVSRVARAAKEKEVERVLVLGGAGYVGSSLVPMLLSRGYKVRVLDRLLFGAGGLAGLEKNKDFELMVGDVRDIQAVVGAIKQCDAVIDLAAIVGDPACDVNKQLSLEVNRAATRMLIEISKGYGISRVVFASTCSVYGASDHLVDELTPPAPISVYAETKVASEQLLLDAAAPDFHPVILRLGTLFGLSPRARFDLVVNLLTARAAATGRITIFNGEQWRPFLHVYDAARAFLAALDGAPEDVSSQIFNVGDYRLNLRLSEVSEKIAAIAPSLEVEHVENGDKRNYRASFDKIHTRLSFRCERTLEFGIREIYGAIISGAIGDFTASQFNNHLVTKTFAESDGSRASSMRTLARLAV